MSKNSSNIISLMDGLYEYELPKMPSDEKQIEGYNLKRSEQVWRRPEIITDFRIMPERNKIEYINGLREKWLNGHWMFIDGEPIWITGMHWDFLVVSKFDFGYPEYLEQQRFDFYFRDLVRKDNRCYGKTILKCRRCGMTAEEIEEAIYTLLEDENSNIGLQSNEYKKCLQTLMYPLIQTYLSRPRFMREEFYSPQGKKPRNSLELISNRVDVLSDEKDDFLGGSARPYPTTPAAMDGTKKRLIIQDESFKWTTASIQETVDINKKCVVEYGIKGKVDVLSTMGDSDDYVQAVKEGCKLVGESNPNVRDANGRTTSGFYKWFVSAIHSADIPEEHRDPAYTKFGKINKDKAEAYVWGEVNKYPKNSKQYVFSLRRLPLEESHAMLAASEHTYFPLIRIDSRLQKLYSLPKDEKPYIIGRLDEDINGKVWFVPDENGKWLVAAQPYFSSERSIDLRNRFKLSPKGVYFPYNNIEGVIGYDPIRYKKDDTVSKNLSLAAIIVYKKFDYFNTGIENEYCGLFLDRPDDPREAHREAIKASKFWGYPCMHEKQVETVKEEFENANMLPFLMKNEYDGTHGIWTTEKRTENGLQMLVTRFKAPMEEGQKDQIDIYPFEIGLEDKKNFDLQNTTSSHITMAEIMCEYGLKQIQYTNISDVGNSNKLDAFQMIIGKRN